MSFGVRKETITRHSNVPSTTSGMSISKRYALNRVKAAKKMAAKRLYPTIYCVVTPMVALNIQRGEQNSHDGSAGASAGGSRRGIDGIAAEGRGGKTGGGKREGRSRRHEGRKSNSRLCEHDARFS